MISTTDLDLAPATGATSSPTSIPSGARKPHPCDACKRSKLKCDQLRPTCSTCQQRAKQCNYSAADEYTDGRVRKFHRRSRKGCSHCKARRVRCDEIKPVCGGCQRKGAAELCIFPPDTGQSSTSRSPSPPRNTAAQAPAGPAPVALETAAPLTTDFFGSQNEGLLGLNNVLPSDNNAVSVWNPTSVPSPNTLLASFFNQQSQTQVQPSLSLSQGPDLFSVNPSMSAFDQHQGYVRSRDPINSGLYADFDESQFNDLFSHQQQQQHQAQPNPDMRQFFTLKGVADRPSPSPATHGLSTTNAAAFDPFSLDTSASSESTPISLNGTTAFDNLTSFIQPAFRNRPEHPAYLFQLGMIDNTDQLSPYFPTLEQRHQYRHFFQETSKSLLVVPVPPAENPFLCHFAHLAFGAPAGQSLSHDAFRFALLSLASLDIGIKMSMAMPGLSQNAMYAISDEQRAESNKRLVACAVSGILKEDATDAELAIATTVALSIRDRLAGCQEWEPPLKIGRDIVVDSGGPAAFINARPTADRRFLVEQLAVLELIGYLTIWVSPKVFGWENEWFRYTSSEEGSDHLHVIYGWTRDAIIYCVRSMILCGEARDIEALREAQPKPGYRQLKDIIESRSSALTKRVRHLLPDGETVKADILLSLASPEVIVGVLGIQACMDLCLRTVILMESIASAQVQAIVKSILDISEESIARGRYAGLLLPLSWADGVAHDPLLKPRAKKALRSLKGHYHLNQDLLERIINIDWATLNDIGLSDWESFLRAHGYYVPCF